MHDLQGSASSFYEIGWFSSSRIIQSLFKLYKHSSMKFENESLDAAFHATNWSVNLFWINLPKAASQTTKFRVGWILELKNEWA